MYVSNLILHISILHLKAGPSSSPVVIDIGAGPSICNIISASLWSNNIFLADLLEGNRRELDKFWRNDEEVWNWEPYFRFQVESHTLLSRKGGIF